MHPLPRRPAQIGRATPSSPGWGGQCPTLLCGYTGLRRSFPLVDLKAGRSLAGLGHGRRVTDYPARARRSHSLLSSKRRNWGPKLRISESHADQDDEV